jgi:hypothetical protein
MPAMSIRAVGATRGFSLVEAIVHLPRLGAWTADLLIAHQDFMAGNVEIRIGDSLVLVGSISRAGIDRGLLHARIVAGANGLRVAVKPKHYTSPTLRKVIADVLGDVGEALSPMSDAAVLNTQFEHWTTIAMPAGQAIRCLVERAGTDIAWRHLPDGTLWVGRDTWPESAVTDFSEAAGASPQADVWEVTLVSPEVLPGTTLGGRRVDQVGYHVTAASLGTTIWVAA